MKPITFLRRHKRKILVGGAAALVVGGVAGYGYYSYQQHLAQQDEQKRVMSQRMRYLYEENRKTVDTAFRSLLPKIRDKLKSLLNVEAFFSSARKSATKDEKQEAWEQIKILSFTRSIASIYSASLLHLFLSVQVNIVGRHLFMKHQYEKQKDRVEESRGIWSFLSKKSYTERILRAEDILDLPESVQQLFLSFVSYFQDNGLVRLVDIIQNVVTNHISGLPLKQLLTPNDMFHLLEAIRNDIDAAFEVSTPSHLTLSSILLESEESNNDFEDLLSMEERQTLKVLTDELRDILDTDDYLNVFREANSGAFTVLHKHMEDVMQNQHQQQQMRKSQQLQQQQEQQEQQQQIDVQTQPLLEENVVKVYLANVLSPLTKETFTILDGSEENEYVWTVHENLMLNKYCVIVYSSGFFV